MSLNNSGYLYIKSKPEHIRVWETYSGCTIPKGYHIHHLDFDKTNNDYSNLVCITQELHAWVHWEMKEAMDYVCVCCGEAFTSKATRDDIRFCSRKCQNKDWTKNNPRPGRYKALPKPEPRNCEQCGLEYQPLKNTKRSLCSRKCRNDANRK